MSCKSRLMLSVFAFLYYLVPVVIASRSQHVLWDGTSLPHPNLWNRTCDEQNILLAALKSKLECLDPSNAPMKPRIQPGPSPYGPWTDVSGCLQGPNGSDVFCVFTSVTFAGGRGISVFTKPAVAEHMAKESGFTDPKVLEGVNFMHSPSYKVQPLPGRGLGAIVNSTLFRGDRVMSYTPVLVIHRETLDVFEDDERFPFQRMAVERLPPHTRDLIYSMHANFGEAELLEDIIDTNSFQVWFGEKKEAHAVLLPETARMNHDCRPNVQYYFDPYTMTHYSHALRTIQVGEELTVTYTDITVARSKRQEAIKFSWGFDCSCSVCRQPEALTRESDKRLELMGELEKKLTDWSNKSVATVDMAETFIALYEQERLDGLIARAYTLAALTYSAMGQEQPAIRYAAQGIERSILNFGPHWGDLQFLRDLFEDPKRHWSWRHRVQKTT